MKRMKKLAAIFCAVAISFVMLLCYDTSAHAEDTWTTLVTRTATQSNIVTSISYCKDTDGTYKIRAYIDWYNYDGTDGADAYISYLKDLTTNTVIDAGNSYVESAYYEYYQEEYADFWESNLIGGHIYEYYVVPWGGTVDGKAIPITTPVVETFTLPSDKITDTSIDIYNPVEINFVSTYSATVNSSKTGKSYYYSFTLTEPAEVSLSLTPADTSAGLEYQIGSSGGYSDIQSSTTATSNTYQLEADTYKIQVGAHACDYTLKLTKTDFKWGNVSCTWSGYKFTATYKPAGTLDAGTLITDWDSNASTDSSYHLSTPAATTSGTVDVDSNETAGWKELYVWVEVPFGKSSLTKKYTIDFAKKPAKVDFSAYNMTVYKTKIKFSGTTSGYGLGTVDNGDKIDIQFYQNGSWVSKKQIAVNSSCTITGLKANTSYKIRVRGIVSSKNSKSAIYGSPSSSITVKTGDTKPSIKSIKTSNAKVKYAKKVWHPAEWRGGYYYKGYYTGGYYYTTFKITIKLKKALKSGSKLTVSNEVCKGSGKTYTINTWTTGKAIGKYVTYNIGSIKSTKYKGYSDTVKKKIKICK